MIIAVADLPAATRTLAALLGRGPSWRGEHPELGTANALFRLSNTYLELLAPASCGPLADTLRARLAAGGAGLVGLAFATDDAEAFSGALRARGVPAPSPQDGRGCDASTGAARRWRSVVLPGETSRGVVLFAIEHESGDDGLAPAPFEAPEAQCVRGLDHVVIATGDVDAARRLYGETLGLRLALDRVFDDRRVRLLFFRVGGVTVEVAHALGAPVEDRDRFLGFALQVASADAARERLVSQGFDVSAVRPGYKPGTRVCSVRGRPLGVDTLLIEPQAPRDARSASLHSEP